MNPRAVTIGFRTAAIHRASLTGEANTWRLGVRSIRGGLLLCAAAIVSRLGTRLIVATDRPAVHRVRWLAALAMAAAARCYAGAGYLRRPIDDGRI